MGKYEDFLHPDIRRKKIEKEKAETLTKKMNEIMSRAIDDFSLDLALEKFGDISYSNEEDFHKLRNSIRKEIEEYFEKNPKIKKDLYETGMAEKNTQEVIKRGLRNIYLFQIKKLKTENSTTRDPNEEEQKAIELVIKSILSLYLSKQDADSQRKDLKEKLPTRSDIAKNKALEKREKIAEDFIRSTAIKFFRKNNRAPSEVELFDLVNKSLEVK